MPIRLLVLDIDGVLTQHQGKSFDLPLLERLAKMNRAARQDPARVAVTVCTGRPAAYVEGLLRAIDGHVPAVCENGAGLYFPVDSRIMPHPMLENQANFQAIRGRLDETLVRTGQAYFQPGKEYSLSIMAHSPSATDALYDLTASALGPLRESVDLVYSVSCLNVLPRGVHKGKGIQFLADQTDYALRDMLGVGDSDVDLPFLANVGYSAAPANANPDVKRLVQFVAPRPAADGVRDILDHFALKS